ncbi:MAG: T9SS type A sorting domain-containing protein [Chitinophagales bacterium]|nr:T9SS type A sorting domain-containing protein [Chitinophagales bacterium]
MKHVFLLFVLLLGLIPMKAQPSIEWQRAIGGSQGDEAFSLQLRNTNQLMVAGFSLSNDGDFQGGFGATEIWLTQMDSLGQVVWRQHYGGTADDRVHSIKSIQDQGWVFAGSTNSNNFHVSGNHGLRDAWVVKLDSTGSIEWQKCLGGSGYDEAWDIVETSDGGYIVVGNSDSNDGDLLENNGLNDIWIIKLDNNGSLLWQHTYGGSDNERGFAVTCTADGGFILAGKSFSDDGDVGELLGGYDYWVLKLNYEGKIEWTRILGGSGHDDGSDIIQTYDGGYAVFGQSRSMDMDVSDNHGNYDLWLVKLDLEGKLVWERSYGGTNEDYGRSIIQSLDGGFIMVGQTQSTDGDAVGNNGLADAWIIKTDSLGNIAWQKSLGGTQDELFHAVEQGADGAIYLAGHARSNNGDVSGVHGKIDYWVVKLGATTSVSHEPIPLRVQLFPNPSAQWLQLGLPVVEQDMQVQISDATGALQGTWKVQSDARLDISGLSSGVYYVSVLSVSGQRYAGQFVKE